MTIPGLALQAISFQSRHGGTKTSKKQVIKLIADRSILKSLISGWILSGLAVPAQDIRDLAYDLIHVQGFFYDQVRPWTL